MNHQQEQITAALKQGGYYS